MKIILSNQLNDNYADYRVVKTVKELKSLTTNPDIECEVLIINEFSENYYEVSMALTSFSKRFKNVVYLYIAARPNKELSNVMQGLNATTTGEVFYLSSEPDLNALVEELQGAAETEETGLVENNNIKIIETYLGYIEENNPRAKVPVIRNQAKKAVTELTVDVARYKNEINEMGSTAFTICKKSQGMIEKLVNQHRITEKKIEKLQDVTNATQKRGLGLQNGIVDFPTFPYLGSKKVIVFKEYSPCRYLTSFVLGYANYLRFVNRKNVKVVIVHPKGKCYTQKYAEFTTISQESMNMESLYSEDLIATNIPKKEVLTKLVQSNSDIIIFIDRLYAEEDIVSGKTIRLNAVSGYSDIERYRVKPEQTIFPSINIPNAFYCIPTVSNYNTNIDARKAVYAQQCKECYDKINALAKVL